MGALILLELGYQLCYFSLQTTCLLLFRVADMLGDLYLLLEVGDFGILVNERST